MKIIAFFIFLTHTLCAIGASLDEYVEGLEAIDSNGITLVNSEIEEYGFETISTLYPNSCGDLQLKSPKTIDSKEFTRSSIAIYSDSDLFFYADLDSWFESTSNNFITTIELCTDRITSFILHLKYQLGDSYTYYRLEIDDTYL